MYPFVYQHHIFRGLNNQRIKLEDIIRHAEEILKAQGNCDNNYAENIENSENVDEIWMRQLVMMIKMNK